MESPIYQEWVKEERAEAEAKGRAEGKVEKAQDAICKYLKRRFGPASEELQRVVRGVTSLDVLDGVMEELFAETPWKRRGPSSGMGWGSLLSELNRCPAGCQGLRVCDRGRFFDTKITSGLRRSHTGGAFSFHQPRGSVSTSYPPRVKERAVIFARRRPKLTVPGT